MNKKTIIYHIAIPILLSILSFFASITFIYKIPKPMGGYTDSTYIFGFAFSMFVLGVSAIISAIMYVGKKKH